MKRIPRLHRNGALAVFFAACLLVGGVTRGQQAQFTAFVRYQFGTNAGGALAPVMLATQPGNTNLFGVSMYGPGGYSGTFFSLSPDYVETTLYGFERNYPGGGGGCPLVLLTANDGNFYGIGNEYIGGYADPNAIYGTFFRLTPSGQYTPLAVFGGTNATYYVSCGQNCRNAPRDPTSLVKDDNDTFYGTTQSTVVTLYRISAGTGWIPVLVHQFAADGSEGYNPLLMTVDNQGNAYGVSQLTNGFGGVFKVNSGGGFSIITPGFAPRSLAADSQGVIYGITEYGGLDNTGEIVRIDAGGSVTVTYNFGPDDTNNLIGIRPHGLFTCSDGKVYGTTYFGSHALPIAFRMQADGTPLRLFECGYTHFLAVNPAGQLVGLTWGPYRLYSVETTPTAITVGVTNIGVTNAVFLGKVNPGSMPTQAWFDYNINTNGSYFRTPAQSVSVATNSVNFSASAFLNLYSLSNYPYYFRAHASSMAGEAVGEVMAFNQVIPRPVITSITRTNGSTTVSWNCFPYLVYQLQYCTNFSTGNWVGIGTATRIMSESSSATDTNSGSGPARWYRVLKREIDGRLWLGWRAAEGAIKVKI